MFVVLKIKAFELIAVNTPYYGKNNWHQKTMGQPTVLRFQISLRETFSKSIYVRMMKKENKGSFM